VSEPASAAERLRVQLCYWWRHGRWPDLATPTRFTELVQHRKLDGRDRRMVLLADKLWAKDHVARLLGPAWITPTLWSGTELPAEAPWPRPFVLKSRHGCRQVAVVRDEDNWTVIRERAASWARRPYGVWLDEWAYRHIPRGFLVETFAGPGPAVPVDYKLFVFGGRVRYVSVHIDRDLSAGCGRQVILDREWRRIAGDGADPLPPVSFSAMIAAAEGLAAPFDFARVDLYDLPCGPRFGEVTFYPGSGLDPIEPWLDLAMGAHWLAARSQVVPPTPTPLMAVA
jgi:hypothetical protein